MSDFDYLALDTAGRERRGSVRAASIEDARATLSARKLYVVRMEAGSGSTAPPLLSRGFFGRKKLSGKQLTLFTRQLATLVTVSPLEESLRTISRQAEQEHVQRVLTAVHSGVVEGRRLSEAMGREPQSFPPLYRAMVSAGETSGTLPQILERLSDLLERQALVRGKVLSALAYPIVLAIVASFVVFALMIFVVPQVVEQFEDVGQELPLLTRIVISLSLFWRTGGGRWLCSWSGSRCSLPGRCGTRRCGFGSTGRSCAFR
jgi:general secretion pathway protein F